MATLRRTGWQLWAEYAPSHALRVEINGYIRERLARDGAIQGPRLEAERLVSRGYTKAEKMLAGNYSPGDVVSFHRAFKSLGVEKGDERRVAAVDDRVGKVFLQAPDGQLVEWRPRWVAAKRGAVEVYRAEALELRAGDRIRWTKNHDGLCLVNSHTAEVTSIGRNRVRFRLEDGRSLTLRQGDAQLRHLDHAWASTVHAFQGRTVDNVIAVMESRHLHLSTQKSFYVEISRARHRAGPGDRQRGDVARAPGIGDRGTGRGARRHRRSGRETCGSFRTGRARPLVRTKGRIGPVERAGGTIGQQAYGKAS